MPGYALKRPLDVIISALLLLLLAPFMLVIAVLVRGSLGRPILFRQQRPGRHQAPFMLYKFRTMRTASEAHEADHLRVTSLGGWLRRWSLDELPELYNVLRGDMSLIGPRPLLPEYLPYYTPEEQERHLVRPGLTGWAQVHGRNRCAWDERLAYDRWYVHHLSLRLDIAIVIRTIRLLFRPGAPFTSPRLDEERARSLTT